MSEIILQAKGIEKRFPGVKALDGVDLEVRRGEVHAIVGENGAGKSTLMLTLGGIHRPNAGSIYLDGEEVVFDSPEHANLRGISIVFQELSLIQNLSIAENIFAHRQPVGFLGFVDRKTLYKKTREMLAFFGLEDLDPSLPVKHLSIANQQIVEILKAMSFNPKVLILDEPTSSLTEIEITRLFSNIRKLKEQGLSFIYISHHLNEIFQIADRVTVLRDGKYVCREDVSDIDEDFLVTNMVGRKIENMYGERSSDTSMGETLLDVRNLGRKNVFSDIDFTLARGEILGIAGLVGAGRTEVGRAIFGADPVDSGEVILEGKRLKINSPKDAIKQGIAYMTEDRKSQGLILEFSIRENLVANHLEDFTGAAGFLDEKKIDSFSEESLENYGIITPSIRQLIGNLSGGNQQKVLIGSWFGISPKVLIVDEPTRGVDVGAKSDIYRLLRMMAAKGVGIIMISSDLQEILGVSDRILVMRMGRFVGEKDRTEATEENIIALAAGAEGGIEK